jgi:hypothetical protein
MKSIDVYEEGEGKGRTIAFNSEPKKGKIEVVRNVDSYELERYWKEVIKRKVEKEK